MNEEEEELEEGIAAKKETQIPFSHSCSSSDIFESFYRFPAKGISAERIASSQQPPMQSFDVKDVDSSEGIVVLEFSDDGSFFISGSNDGDVLLWSSTSQVSGEEMATNHNGDVYCLAMSPDNDSIFSGGMDGQILIHDNRT